MDGREFRRLFDEGALDAYFDEVVMYYNVIDQHWYIYKKGAGDDHWYGDSNNKEETYRIFEQACSDLKKAHGEGV